MSQPLQLPQKALKCTNQVMRAKITLRKLPSTAWPGWEGMKKSVNKYYRSPLMVAIAMIEHGATPEEAIKIIRNARSGALNMKQTNFLLHY
jgi:hypothetical protein